MYENILISWGFIPPFLIGVAFGLWKSDQEMSFIKSYFLTMGVIVFMGFGWDLFIRWALAGA